MYRSWSFCPINLGASFKIKRSPNKLLNAFKILYALTEVFWRDGKLELHCMARGKHAHYPHFYSSPLALPTPTSLVYIAYQNHISSEVGQVLCPSCSLFQSSLDLFHSLGCTSLPSTSFSSPSTVSVKKAPKGSSRQAISWNGQRKKVGKYINIFSFVK